MEWIKVIFGCCVIFGIMVLWGWSIIHIVFSDRDN